ncbi:MAG TPA: histidine triad nucleotide-binding protein [Gammaproteobacteria bacterium]|nr:histidine triad nucleotide-binding protein [Gammaproteobacteria bacterium]
MTDCLFCKMVNGEIKPDAVYEDDDILAFNDINPRAPTHILIIPKKHIATLNDVEESDTYLLGKLSSIAAELASNAGFARDGYRLVMNCNAAGGQAVYHIHLHLLAGRQMSWPPG